MPTSWLLPRDGAALAQALGSVRFWLGNAVVAAAYALVGFGVSRFFADFGLFPAPGWPSAGVAIAATLAGGWRYLPGILVGSFAVNHFLFAPPLAVTAGISLTNAFGPLVGAWLIRRATDTALPFDRVGDVALFIVHGVALHAAIAATGGAAMTWAGGVHGTPDVPAVWLEWFLADAGGALFFGPTVLLWWLRPGLPPRGGPRLGFLALTAGIALLTAAVFFELIFATAGLAGLPYILVPLLIWGTLRFTPRESATWVSLVVVLATVGTLLDHGPFQAQTGVNGIASMGLMVCAVSVTALLAGALAQERRRDAAALARTNAMLEDRVAERTAALEAELAERREAERLLEIMRFAVDHSTLLFFLVDRHGRIHYVNEEAARVTGYGREALLERTIFDLRPDLAADDWEEHWWRIRAGRVAPRQVELHTRAGERVPTEITPHYIEVGDAEYDFQFVQDIRERKRAQEQLAHYAAHDPLTGVLNRREWFTRARAEVRRSTRSAVPLAVLMLDLDEFKPLNDRHGHDAGDQALRAFVDTCRSLIRDYDVIGRFGGEEFVILAPETERAAALALAERLREGVAEREHRIDGTSVRVTVSVGVATWEPGEGSIDPAITRADRALYAAKRAGRNRVSG